MAKITIDEKNARELAEQVAHELFEIQQRKFKEMQEEMEKKLDDIGLRGSPYAPVIPDSDVTETEIAEDIEFALTEGESDKFEVMQ